MDIMSIKTKDIILGDSNISKIINKLEEVFPITTPQPTDSINDIMYKSGQRSVVEYIIQEFKED